MPCNDPEYRGWIGVRNGSTFRLEVTGADAAAVRASVDGKEVDFESPVQLASPHRYRWWVSVRHGEDDPRVRASVTKPNGDPHGTPYCHMPEGDPGETDLITLKAITRTDA